MLSFVNFDHRKEEKKNSRHVFSILSKTKIQDVHSSHAHCNGSFYSCFLIFVSSSFFLFIKGRSRTATVCPPISNNDNIFERKVFFSPTNVDYINTSCRETSFLRNHNERFSLSFRWRKCYLLSVCRLRTL